MPPKQTQKASKPAASRRTTDVPKSSLIPQTNRRLTDIPKSPQMGSPTSNSSMIIDPLKLSDINDTATDIEKTPQKSTKGKKHCPCGKSSGGEDWLLTCLECKQVWHNCCAGLKAEFTQNVLDSLLAMWQCPWCYNCPYTKPATHSSIKTAKDISEKVFIASTIQQISDSVADKVNTLSSSITNLENRLSSVIADNDSIRSTLDQIVPKVLQIGDIETHMQHQLLSQAALDHKMKTLQVSIAKLQEEITNFSTNRVPPSQPATLYSSSTLDSATTITPHNQEAVCGLSEDFVDNDSAKSVVEFLNESTFSNENGHSVLSFGVPYKYIGSRSSNGDNAIPPNLQPMLDQVNQLQEEAFFTKYPDYKKYGRPAPLINSILVNKYEGPDCHLPKHSDNEDSIHPESNIFTISLGAECTLDFAPKSPSSEDIASYHSLTCKDRSIYSMSRKSQDFFTHEIKAGKTQNGIRYSITFRSVSKWNSNSTCILGDSNTGRLNFGADVTKSFGERLPGHRFWAPVVEKIEPSVCSSYSNVVLMCGTNNIRKINTRNSHELDSIYEQYISKIEEIRRINSKCKIFVCPILPTKSFALNQGALYLNNLFFTDLVQRDLGVQSVSGFNSFLERDKSGLLAKDLSREFDKQGMPDILHLNISGTRLLAKFIKHTVFGKSNQGNRGSLNISRSYRVNGRSFSSIAASSIPAGDSAMSST